MHAETWEMLRLLAERHGEDERVRAAVLAVEILEAAESHWREKRDRATRLRHMQLGNAQNMKDWVDPKILHEVMAAPSDVEPHFSNALTARDQDDIRSAIRAELGRNFDTASMSLRDVDPERWYETGRETWEPEEPDVLDDRTIHRLAVARDNERRRQLHFMRERPTIPRRPTQRRKLDENAIEWLAGGTE